MPTKVMMTMMMILMLISDPMEHTTNSDPI
jgi:hypothetical protein